MNQETGLSVLNGGPAPVAMIETASTAAASAAKAEIEAQYVIAYKHPRNIEQARINLLGACKRPVFAASAIYRKPVGKKQNPDTGAWEQSYIEGLSIRAAEEAVRAMGNIRIASSTVFEDAETRKKRVTVTDLESNISYNREITLGKTVEKKAVKDKQGKFGPPAERDVIGQRLNTYGQTVYICRATEDELTIKEAALTSKIIRTEGLRLVPSDIQEEAKDQCYETMSKQDAVDPKAAMRKIIDAFAGVGVNPDELVKFLKHGLDQINPSELATLRAMFSAIKEGEATWKQYMDTESGETQKPEDQKPKGKLFTKPETTNETPPQAETTEVQTVASLETACTIIMEKLTATNIKFAYAEVGLNFDDDPPLALQTVETLWKLLKALESKKQKK